MATLLALKRFVTRTAYRKDIIIALLMKFAALCLLWAVIFGHPAQKELTSTQVAERLLAR